jgi:hypothetical protein
MNKKDCKYFSHRIIKVNKPDEKVRFGEIPHCRLFLLDIKECPVECVHYYSRKLLVKH